MDILQPPTWLDRVAKAYFKSIAPDLLAIGKLDSLSLDLVAAAAQAYSTYRHALDKLKEEGRVVTHPRSGVSKTNPWCQVEGKAIETLLKVWKDLHIGGKPPLPPADDLDTFIDEGR